ncbi:hypothetical protein HZB88_01590 [archaeon]|nr:hypothetical protein [archaeon]
MPKKETPIDEALELMQQGLANEQAAAELEARGYSIEQISDAINQASIKMGVEGEAVPSPASVPEEEPPVPEYQEGYPEMPATEEQGLSQEDIQKLAEQIIEEKWREVSVVLNDIREWKMHIAEDLEATKQELLRLSGRFDNMQTAVIGKVKDYNQSIIELSSDVKALESVMQKIMEPFTENVKELSRITEKMRKK